MIGCDKMCNTELLDKILYDKSYTCPLCSKDFKSKAIRLGKNQLVSIDDDLYPHYSMVNPLFYSVITCPHCGYSALAKTFGLLLPKQKEWLSEQFAPYKPHPQYSEYTNSKDALSKYKMALFACMTKKSHISEQAYIALNIAWIYRDEGDTQNEQLFLKRAYSGFSEAFTTERFPILGMDELTFTYTLAAIAYEIGEFEDSKQYLSTVITSTGCPPRIKEHALNLKQKLFNTSTY